VPDAAAVDVFHREAELLGLLRHDRLPRALGHFSEGAGVHTRLYLVLSHVEGDSLEHLLTQRSFAEPELRAIAAQVLEILLHLHTQQPPVIHRDVKPANLLEREGGEIHLVDFGSARTLLGAQTHRATLVGTFGYMPPEQLGGTVDATCDLYALGATLVHLLTRRPPEESLVPGEPLRLPAGRVSPGVERFLQQLCAPRREDRFGSALAALEALAGREAPAVAPRARPRRAGVAALLLGGLLLGGLADLAAHRLLAPAAGLGPLGFRPDLARGWEAAQPDGDLRLRPLGAGGAEVVGAGTVDPQLVLPRAWSHPAEPLAVAYPVGLTVPPGQHAVLSYDALAMDVGQTPAIEVEVTGEGLRGQVLATLRVDAPVTPGVWLRDQKIDLSALLAQLPVPPAPDETVRLARMRLVRAPGGGETRFANVQIQLR
jgi:hypothetical protein